MALLEIRNVSRRFGDFAAVDNISLSIEAGEFFTLLGPSGCGKTTLLRMIAGFDLPDSGQILLDGVDLVGIPPEQRPVCTVFQNYALFPHMTVAANIAFPLKMAKVPADQIRTRVEEALEDVRLAGFAARFPHELSGGQRQRVAVARALVSRPKLLLLDEPLSALDAKLREQMQIELINLQKEVDITFVYVTHDQGEALAMSDRIAVMNKGVVEQIGSPTEIYNLPKTPFVAGFIGKTNLLEGRRGGAQQLTIGDLEMHTQNKVQRDAPTISLRQECVLLGDAAIGQPNFYTGVVEDVVFFGHEKEVSVAVCGQTIVSRISGLGPTDNGPRPGDSIPVGWSLTAPVILEEATP
jgi:spermidine/putrescine transport system ATP-binding protein